MRAVSWQAVADVATWFFLAYFIALAACYLLLNVCSLLELPRVVLPLGGSSFIIQI